MPCVRPARERDIEAVTALLHEHMNRKIPPERWRRLMVYPWRPVDVELGWLVESHGRVVGFMGTIYSDRQVRGKTQRFCDLSSWYLLADYRGDGTGDRLLQAGMALPNVIYQTMTARRATGRKIRALGFSILDDTRSLFRARKASQALAVERNATAVRMKLTPSDRSIFDEHADFGLHHAWLDEHVWLVWQRKLKGDAVAYHEMLHCSDPAFLAAKAQQVADTIVEGENGVLAVDSRWMIGANDKGTVEQIPLPRWFRGDGAEPQEIDHLYSEIILLDQKLP